MNVRKVIRRRIRRTGEGSHISADVNAVVSANIGEPGSRSSVRSRQRIVQRSGTAPERDDDEGGARDG
jgi:hypothetical protein